MHVACHWPPQQAGKVNQEFRRSPVKKEQTKQPDPGGTSLMKKASQQPVKPNQATIFVAACFERNLQFLKQWIDNDIRVFVWITDWLQMSSQQDALQEDAKACGHHVQKCRFVSFSNTRSDELKSTENIQTRPSDVLSYPARERIWIAWTEEETFHWWREANMNTSDREEQRRAMREFVICVERSWCGGRKSLRELWERDDPINGGRVSNTRELTSYMTFFKHERQTPARAEVGHVTFLDRILRTCVKPDLFDVIFWIHLPCIHNLLIQVSYAVK